MVLLYVVYEICRLVFLATNWSVFSEAMTWGAFGEMLHGGWYFDTSAILYTNALQGAELVSEDGEVGVRNLQFHLHYSQSGGLCLF